MKKIIVLFLSVVLCSCASKGMKEYDDIKNANETPIIVMNNIYNFELQNPDHFLSKLDLARYFILLGNYEESERYLIRAEGVINKIGKRGIANEDIAALYGCLAVVNLADQNLQTAWDYTQKAYKIPKAGKYYGYLAGRVLASLGRKEEAIQYFDKTYALYPEQISGEELRAYMYLAADANDWQKCMNLLELYFEKGLYFPNLGLFASGVYEKNGRFVKSIYAAYLDYEYQSGLGGADDAAFVRNLHNLKTTIITEGKGKDAEDAVDIIIGLYDTSGSGENTIAGETDFFPYKYIMLKKKAEYASWDEEDFQEYITLEKYFASFPGYYWMLWEEVQSGRYGEVKQWIPILEKIILLGDSIYIKPSRKALANLANIGDTADRLLLPQEVQQLFVNVRTTNNGAVLEPFFDLLELPDCSYVMNALLIARSAASDPMTRNILSARNQSATGRLRERLSYILS